MPGEDDEIINGGMYGKALANYLQAQLKAREFDAPFVCAEDWGWWVELRGFPFQFGVCIYCDPKADEPLQYGVTHGATSGKRVFKFRQFRFIETTPYIKKLFDALEDIFKSDPDVEWLGFHPHPY